MSLPLTTIASQLLEKNEITPQIVLQIDGVETLYGAVDIKEIWRIGDPGRFIGEPGLTIGGQVSVDDQETLISWSGGTSNSINQTLNVDKGTNDSVSKIKVALIDKSLKATELITPGAVVEDILGRKAKIWLGEASGSWKDDYNIIFRGLIDEIDAKSGVVTLNVSSPDALKNKTTFLPAETELDGAMSDVDLTMTVLDATDFLEPYTGPSGSIDTSLRLYVKIEDEIMRYETTTGTTIATLTRGQLGTTAVAHLDGTQVQSFYRIDGNAIDLALKFMLSGRDAPYLDDYPAASFVTITGTESVDNSIFLADFDVEREFNIRVGDFATSTGATNPANDFVNRQITEVTLSSSGVGYYVAVDGAPLVAEATTSALIDFTSKYDVWGPGAGLAMLPEEVDIAEHLDIQRKFLSSAEYDFYLKEEIEDGKEFISEQLYNPVSAFAIPRKAQASLGYNVGPIPGTEIKTLNADNITNISTLSIKRSTNKNFFNTIIYKFEEEALEDRLTRGTVFIEGTSVTRIPVGNKALTIEARGFREILSAINTAQIASNRRLKRYRFGAEQIRGLKTSFSNGFSLEIGDKIILDMSSAKVSDIKSGTRDGDARLYELTNKTLNIRNGEVTIDILDTNFDLDSRYGLISPASKIKAGTSGTEFVINPSFNTDRYGTAEWKKWIKFVETEVVIRSSDYSVQGRALLKAVTSNTIKVETDLGFTPLVDYIMECGDYDNQTEDVKLVYTFQSDADNNFADGKISYKMS